MEGTVSIPALVTYLRSQGLVIVKEADLEFKEMELTRLRFYGQQQHL